MFTTDANKRYLLCVKRIYGTQSATFDDKPSGDAVPPSSDWVSFCSSADFPDQGLMSIETGAPDSLEAFPLVDAAFALMTDKIATQKISMVSIQRTLSSKGIKGEYDITCTAGQKRHDEMSDGTNVC